MRQFTFTINCDSPAFGDNPASEIAVLLAHAAENVAAGVSHSHVVDSQGSRVGNFGLDGDARPNTPHHQTSELVMLLDRIQDLMTQREAALDNE